MWVTILFYSTFVQSKGCKVLIGKELDVGLQGKT